MSGHSQECLFVWYSLDHNSKDLRAASPFRMWTPPQASRAEAGAPSQEITGTRLGVGGVFSALGTQLANISSVRC